MHQIIVRKEENNSTVFEFKNHMVLNVPNHLLGNILSDYSFQTLENNEKISCLISDTDIEALKCNCNYSINDLKIKYPIAICLMVTNKCNMCCSYCLVRLNKKEEKVLTSSIENYVQNIAELNPLCCWITGGEPLIYDNLIELIKLLAKQKIYLTIDTNGLLSNKIISNPDFISTILENRVTVRISLDGHIEKINNTFRSNYYEVVENIIKLRELGIEIAINTVVSSANYKYLDEMADFILALKVSGWNLYQLQEGFSPKEALIKKESYIEAIKSIVENNKSNLRVSPIFGNIPYSSIVVNPFGDIYTSNTLTGENIILSNIYNESYVNILLNNYGDNIHNHTKKYLNTIF